MSLSNDIISLLCDEAYLKLCRERIDKGPARTITHAKEIAETCALPGLPVSPGRAKPLEPAIHIVPGSGSRQEACLTRIEALEDWLKPTLHAKLKNYLQEASYDYFYGVVVLSAITRWERQLNPYGDCLQAFVLELKNVARTLGGTQGSLYASFDLHTAAVAALRLSAGDLDRASLQMNSAAVQLNQAIARTIFDKVSVPAPPFAGLVQWVDRLALLSNVEALFKMQAKEAEARSLLANKLLPLHSRATTAREAVDQAQRDYLESYWNELRDHALAHYVKDREVDEVLDELTASHGASLPPRGRRIMQDDDAVILSA